MKHALFFFCASLLTVTSIAQTNTFPSSGAVGIGTTMPNASSLLEIKSTKKGLLISRMTKIQRDSIKLPATGLLIYQTDKTPGFYYYNGSAWTTISLNGSNRSLSNLISPTAINQSLLPDKDNAQDLGAELKNWRNIYLDSILYLKGNITLHATGIDNFFAGRNAGNLNVAFGGYNTGLGHDALNHLTFGSNNTATGYEALYANSGASNNTADGAYALFSNTTGENNTAFGSKSLYYNTTGSWNIANGFETLLTNTEGYENTAIGTRTMKFNTTGYYNTGNGYGVLYRNTTGFGNTASGYESLFFNKTGYSNVAIGAFSLYYNTNRSNLVAIGDSALYNNNKGAVGSYAQATDNTAVGSKTLFANTTGYGNTANGAKALYSNIDGYFNTANGWHALYFNTSGYVNTASGHSALGSNTTGYNNTAVGSGALGSNTTGDFNTATGVEALGANTTGSLNSAFGFDAGTLQETGFENITAIGAYAFVDGSNKARIGNENVTSIGGQVSWTSFSDARYKKNIKKDVQGLAFINLLEPITYTLDINGLSKYYDKGRKPDSTYEKVKTLMRPSADEASKIVYNGFIAQNVEKAAKKLNYDFSGVDKPQTADGLYGLRYSDFVVPLVKAVQELSKQNDEMKKNYETKIDELQNQINELKTMIVSNQSSAIISSSSLQQNVPNPFNHTTTITYTLPQTYSSAKIVVMDKNGKILKQVNVSGNGKGTVNVDAATLSSGAYQYSLYVNGKLIDTKQMMLQK